MTDEQALRSTARRSVPKVVEYVVHNDRLLVFTHDDVAIGVAGVQVPAGTIESGEHPADAVVREVWEEAGIVTRVVADLGVDRYDLWPSKAEVHERHFFLLEPRDRDVPERWAAGESDPSGGGPRQSWTCWWMPLRQARILTAGFGSRIGSLSQHLPRP